MEIWHIMVTAVNAIMPIILLIFFGYWLRRINFLTDDFAKTASKLVFRVCLSCSLFINIYRIEDVASIKWDLVIYAVAVVCLLFVLGLVAAVTATKDIRRRSAILHSIFRSNFAIIGLSLASALGGAKAETVAAVVSAFVIPLFNILGVVALTVFNKEPDESKHGMKRIVTSVAKNPIIIGAIVGLICQGIRFLQSRFLGQVVFSIKEDIPFVYTAVNDLKTILSPLALMVLGAQFKFSAVKGMFREIATGTLWRIVIAPLIAVGGAVMLSSYTDLLSCGVNEYPTLIALFGSPTAISTAIMAGEMGGDEQLATQIVVWTSLGSILTIYLQVCILMGMGLL